MILGISGRVGQKLAWVIENDETLHLYGGTVRKGHAWDGTKFNMKTHMGSVWIDSDTENVLDDDNIDIIFDFTDAKSALENLRIFRRVQPRGAILIVGTTGFSEDDKAKFSNFDDVFLCENMSRGMEYTKRIIDLVSTFDPADILNIVINETHHANKKDSPSGTALMLREKLAVLDKEIIHIESTRDRDLAGIHEVVIYMVNESMHIKCCTDDIDAYAYNAVKIAKKIVYDDISNRTGEL